MTMMVQSVMKKTGINRVTGALTDIFKRGKKAVTGEELAQQFKTWVTSSSLEEKEPIYLKLPEDARSFAAWIAGLPDRDLAAFTGKVADFCKDANFDLAWLTDASLASDPTLKRALEATVLLYCLSYWQADQTQDHIKALGVFQKWREAPMSGKYQDLTQKMFPKLVEQGLVSEPISAPLLFSEEERRSYIVQAIQKAAEQDMAAVLEVLKAVQ
ncbi:MAG: hypothetical protein HC884_01410 [Chloroflexaceae bacterium]|nr:hypothetical protein [Chloroflexaceae bacterium]